MTDAYDDAAEIDRIELAEREIVDLGGFQLAPLWEPTHPYICTICGCAVSRPFARVHRSRCQ